MQNFDNLATNSFLNFHNVLGAASRSCPAETPLSSDRGGVAAEFMLLSTYDKGAEVRQPRRVLLGTLAWKT
jgi:hypothetical protein